MHVSDILPTVVALAGVQINASAELDGIDQWNVMSDDAAAVRDEIIEHDNYIGYGFYIKFPYKLVDGRHGSSDWLSKEYENNEIDPAAYPALVLNSTVSKVLQSIQRQTEYLTAEEIIALRNEATITCSNSNVKTPCDRRSLCLFNIYEDPCEENDLSKSSETLMQSLTARFNNHKKKTVPSRRKGSDPACDPANFDNHWHFWQNDTL